MATALHDLRRPVHGFDTERLNAGNQKHKIVYCQALQILRAVSEIFESGVIMKTAIAKIRAYLAHPEKRDAYTAGLLAGVDLGLHAHRLNRDERRQLAKLPKRKATA